MKYNILEVGQAVAIETGNIAVKESIANCQRGVAIAISKIVPHDR
jgi:hypothetical protein